MKAVFAAAIVAVASALPSAAATLVVSSDLGKIGEVTGTSGRVAAVRNDGWTWTDIAIDARGRTYVTDGIALYRLRGDKAVLLGEHAYMNGLAFDGEGRLFGTGDGKLYRLNKRTGKSRTVGRVGKGFESSGDIAFDGKGRLWATSIGGCDGKSDCLFRINAETGKGRYIGDLGQSYVYGLAMDRGRLIGVTDDDRLLRIDRATGAAAVFGHFRQAGIASGLASWTPPKPPTPIIPLPASALLLLTALGALFLRRS